MSTKDNRAAAGSEKMNIIFHGMFVFKLDADGINVFLPKIEGHHAHEFIVRWDGKEYRLPELKNSTSPNVVIEGLTGNGLTGGIRTLLNMNKAHLSANFSLIPDLVHTLFRLEYPVDIADLRVVRSDSPIFTGDSHIQNPDLASLAMVNVFRYNLSESGAVVKDSSGNPIASGTGHLHFHAEPRMAGATDHVDLLNRDFVNSPNLKFADPCLSSPPIEGNSDFHIDPKDTQSLSEIGARAKGGETSNCLSVYIDE